MTAATLPPFVPQVGDDVRGTVVERLHAVEAECDVRILFAVESGSRAWGFPSPDSDYDVRFVYVHRLDWYLALTPGRDVIELPIRDDLDIGGWDLRKALTLLLKPNPVMLEWLSSPIRYFWNAEVGAELADLAQKTAHASACLRHYLHLGEGQWRRHVGDGTDVSYKKYFYVLRPALAIRWVRLNPDAAPPMNIQAMSHGLDLDAETVDAIARLLALKRAAREMGVGPRMPGLDRLVQDEFAWARQASLPEGRRDLRAEANGLFRRIVLQADCG
ncbi:MAG: nucleotidyltransferase domain-containing protein [Rhodospirillaceae bacterium]|nr:nucleotidyltransferase domain-containing protein [Rhodospirillaceae bacterium]